MSKLSIHTSTYNRGYILGKAYDSLCSQTVKDFEWIISDDGSTDNSGDLCDKYKTKGHRITVIHTENNGASIARKIGLNYSTVKYIAFVDADDYVNPKYIEKLYSLLIHYNVTISACRVQRVKIGQEISTNNTSNTVLLKFDELMPRFFI